MILAEDIRKAILELADQRGPEVFYAAEVAKNIDPGNWKNIMDQVRLVASVLIKERKIILLNSVSPDDIVMLKDPIKLSKAP